MCELEATVTVNEITDQQKLGLPKTVTATSKTIPVLVGYRQQTMEHCAGYGNSGLPGEPSDCQQRLFVLNQFVACRAPKNTSK